MSAATIGRDERTRWDSLQGVIPDIRLRNQFLNRPFAGTAAELVAWMGAVQAQEYEHARWGLGLRLAGRPTAADIEQEIAAGRILRTHVLRPTWHFVAAADLRWMLELTAPRVHSRMAPYNRHLELDTRTLTRATTLIERALADAGCLTRAELGEVLRRARIAVTPMRLAHIAMHAELERVICSGPRRDRQFTYALMSRQAPEAMSVDKDAALGELGRRFFQSHGPATVRDFVWWSGLLTAEAKRAIEIARARPFTTGRVLYWTIDSATAAGRPRTQPHVRLLPIYDEYVVAYRDRVAVPHRAMPLIRNVQAVSFQHALVIDGQIAGTWRTRTRTATADVTPGRKLSSRERKALDLEVRRYVRFVT